MSDEAVMVAGDHFHVCKDCGQVEPMWLFESHHQDTLDGLALRRLREALPDEYKMRVSTSVFNALFYVDVWSTLQRGALDPTQSHHWIGMSGATIAEAADKCREALEAMG